MSLKKVIQLEIPYFKRFNCKFLMRRECYKEKRNSNISPKHKLHIICFKILKLQQQHMQLKELKIDHIIEYEINLILISIVHYQIYIRVIHNPNKHADISIC